VNKQILRGAFAAAVDAATPAQCIAAALPERPSGRVIVIGAGKAAAQMAAAVEAQWGDAVEGLVVTRYGHAEGVSLRKIGVVEASHPVPDQAGLDATRRIMDLLSGLTPNDLVLSLISGGGSALLCQPIDGISLDDKQELTRALLACGATIGEMNVIRQRLSQVKGGRLAALAAPAKIVTLFISDVPGDDAETVASGPTVRIPPHLESAETILARYNIIPNTRVAAALASQASRLPETGDLQAHMVASPRQSLEAAARYLESQGYTTLILSDRIEGEAREVGKALTAIAMSADFLGKAPLALISGGETSVTLRGNGRGGRNAEFALGVAIALRGARNISCLAADTDGIDGSEDNAGAYVDGESFNAMKAAGVDPFAALTMNDAWGAFNAIDSLFVTGPTGTNVNDLRIFLIDA
jgi:hydroxypyruvate reductase